MAAGEWRVMICKTLDGTIVSDLAISAPPGYTRKLNDMGSFSVSCRVDAPENASVDLHSYVSPMYSWVVCYQNYIVQSGPVWSYSFDDNSRVLTVSGSGIGGIFSRRVTRNAAGTTAIVDPSQDLGYTNLSLRAIMGGLIRDNMAQTYAGLPIVLGNLAETGTNSRTYYGYDLKNVADNLQDLANVDQGPEFDFAPQFVNSNQQAIQWVLNCGNPTLGDQASNGAWDYGGSLMTIDVDVNASVSPVSRVWVKGTGSERSLLTGFYQDLTQAAAGYPLLDYMDASHTSATVQSTLDGWAKSDQTAYSAPFEQWTASIRVDGGLSNSYGNRPQVAPGLGDFALGDAPLFFVDGHPWIKSGQYRRRIQGFSSNGPWQVNLDLFQTLSFS